MSPKKPTVKLFGHEYTIESVVADELTDSNGNLDEGQTRFHDGNMLLLDTLKPARKCFVLAHEIIHAIENHLGLEFDDREVDALATGFIELLVQNDMYKVLGVKRKGK
jgi:hypothetical protein